MRLRNSMDMKVFVYLHETCLFKYISISFYCFWVKLILLNDFLQYDKTCFVYSIVDYHFKIYTQTGFAAANLLQQNCSGRIQDLI